jgi:hypothetical protein
VYVNGKMIHFEPSPGIVGEGNKGEWWGGLLNSSMLYLIHCKNFCKCHNAPPPSTTIKKEKLHSQGISE